MSMDEKRAAHLRVAANCGIAAAWEHLGEEAPRPAPDLQIWPGGWDAFGDQLVNSSLLAPGGRIWFPGNPFPGGHTLESLTINAVLTNSELQVTIELTSVNYDAESDATDPEDLEDLRDWQSVGVWQNYNSCILGGTFVRPFDLEPLDLASTFELTADQQDGDVLEGDYDDLAFWHCYILGHDSVADHRVLVTQSGAGSQSLVWDGRVALTYAGDHSFDHVFLVEHPAIPAIRLSVEPTATPEGIARSWLSRAVLAPETYAYLEGGTFEQR